MNDLLEVAYDVQLFCDSQGWKSCVIGGLAVQRWGEPRVTRDVDLTLLTGFGKEDLFVRSLLDRYPSRITDPISFARRNRVALLQSRGAIGIDISFGALPFEELAISRATEFSFTPGLPIRTCSAEDLLVMKLFAYRPVDLRDAESVVLRHGQQLDWSYVELQLRPLAELKNDHGILQEMTRLRKVV
jgi:hypothetical protein